MALDVYLYEERLPFKCMCSLSVQHRENERIIKELIDAKRTTLPTSIRKDPFYRHRRFNCRNCLDRQEKAANWMILHSSEFHFYLDIIREAYVCLQCFSVYRKNTIEYSRFRMSVNNIFDSFFVKHSRDIQMANCLVVHCLFFYIATPYGPNVESACPV